VKWIPEFARKQKEALGSVRLQGTRVEASTLTLERFGKVHVSRSADYCKPSTHGAIHSGLLTSVLGVESFTRPRPEIA
jgi:hypothetical protein